MIDTIEYKGHKYPSFQAEGFAAQWVFPFAKRLLSGKGYDIGCNRSEWKLPLEGCAGIDLNFNNGWHAGNLPKGEVDYIFSSHCLEHIPDWVGALDYWSSKIKYGGIIFLYLPHRSQRYWQPQNNRKHIHSFDGEELKNYFEDRGFENILLSGVDLNNSFTIVADK